MYYGKSVNVRKSLSLPVVFFLEDRSRLCMRMCVLSFVAASFSRGQDVEG